MGKHAHKHFIRITLNRTPGHSEKIQERRLASRAVQGQGQRHLFLAQDEGREASVRKPRHDHRDFAGWVQQKCFAHFLKTLAQLEREKTRGAVRFQRALAAVLRQALALRDEKPRLSARELARRRNRTERRLDALIAEGRRFSDPDNRRFAKRLRKQRRHLFTFLDPERADVEATNNRAERALRPAVIIRETGGCNKTARGARTHAVLASLLVTARQRGVDALRYLGRLLTTLGPPPALLAVPTDSS
ncbi:MAG TPA: hypothetical protein ENN65_08755 [Candidatus Hydrogenedentes bacterium]|nr:hypothetical protein [Candidatus Hydrogenedentota bacterium]